ncbi:MAG: glycosyltransferase family 39 protein [Actinomycetales bacterium]|nr:glycosyltransferase family 39 protein [Actinomycetales bacterium]
MQPDAPAQASPDPWVPYAVTAIAVLLAGLYGLAASSANLHDYYTPAVVSMSQGLGQFVYGAFDSAGWSGIDKIPGSLWPQALSVAALGPSAWSVVLPEVLATIATVVVLYLAVARWRGRMAGLVAAAVYATTPLVAVLSRSNVPEVWFSLAAVISAYFLIRAIQTGRLPWLILAGLGIAAAFQVKMMEAWMLYPGPMADASAPGTERDSWIAANCRPVPDAPLVSGASSGRRTGTLVDCAVTAPGRG